MNFVCRSRRLTAWIATFAILLAALAPGISQAVASSRSQSAPWSEICTAAGMQVRQDAAATGAPGEHEGMMSRHCPFCLNHAGQFALPATPLEFSLAIDVSAKLFFFLVTTSSPRLAWTAPPSRAPPANS